MTCSHCGKEVDVAVLRSCVADTWKALEQSAEQLQVPQSQRKTKQQAHKNGLDAPFVTCIVLWPVCEIPIQSWRSAKDLEEQFVFYTAQYAKLLDLVSHPCRLLYKVKTILEK